MVGKSWTAISLTNGEAGTVVDAEADVEVGDVTLDAGGLLAGSCLILLALKAMLLAAAAKAGDNRGDNARTTVAAEGRIPFDTGSSK